MYSSEDRQLLYEDSGPLTQSLSVGMEPNGPLLYTLRVAEMLYWSFRANYSRVSGNIIVHSFCISVAKTEC